MFMDFRFLVLFLITFPAFAQRPEVALNSLFRTEKEPDQIKTCLELSKVYADNQPDSAVHYCNLAMRLAEKLNDKHSLGLLLLEMGRINSLHHQTDLARSFDNEALSVFRNISEAEGIAQAYDELGLLDGQQQDLKDATRDFKSAMKFYADSHDKLGILETYHGLGQAYEEKGANEKALSYYLRALVQYEHRQQKPETYFLLLDHIGHLYLKKGDNASALKYLQEGVHNSNTTLTRDTQVTLLNEEGKVYEHEGLKTQAMDIYKQALKAAKKYNLPEEQARVLINIAGVLKNDNAAQSLVDLKRALQLADSLHQPQLEANIYAAIAGIYQQQKDYKEAMEALEENHRLVDSLLDVNTNKEIASLDSSYALERSLKKIGSLQKINKDEKIELKVSLALLVVVIGLLILLWLYLGKVNRLNKELKAANRVKDTLFSIIGHDLKGPAGSAAQLFALMEMEDLSETELKSMVSELKKQTESSFELLQSLFEWGKAQLQGVQVSPELVDSKTIIQKNIAFLLPQATEKRITISDHTADHIKLFADPHHFDFIIRNLLSNAIKFTYEHGHIELEARKEGKEVIYAIKDNGRGISQEQQIGFLKTNLQVSFGTKGEKGSGLGLLLIKDFIAANKGRIWLESVEGKGTEFYIAFPADK
jgi:signal transduction histidine kinase